MTYDRFERAFGSRDAPFAFVDLDAMWRNSAGMLARAAGKPIRIASKSIRVRELIGLALASDPGYAGLMTFTLRETLWLAGHGFEDLLLAYPTTDREALRELARSEAADPVLMVDSPDHLDLIDAAMGAGHREVRLCIEIDLAYPLLGGRVRIGPKRSAIRTPGAARALAAQIGARPGFRLSGLMGYEGHVAGLGDRPPGRRLRGMAIERMQRASVREMAERRGAIVTAVREEAELDFVNGGGTGSLHLTTEEDAVTELTAGSGFFAPALFDGYASFDLSPAAGFALPIARKPGPRTVTALGGGYLASGPADRDRLPVPWLPEGLALDPNEGAGEVQTPLSGDAVAGLRVGDRVYMRHSKAGELCERFDSVLLVEDDAVTGEVPTYRGEGQAFL
ncbi:MAG: amino acid deaminase/aldolase [Thermoleophilaceae bacterium]|nr:amino acid deaminase/aldolase [Thermoleophilaceae bacterium]